MANETRHIRDVMTPNPQTVTERDSVHDAARIMKEQDTGVVPVVDGKKIIGMITDRDIVVRCVADGKNPLDASVKDVMTRSVRQVKEDATFHYREVETHRASFSCLPVDRRGEAEDVGGAAGGYGRHACRHAERVHQGAVRYRRGESEGRGRLPAHEGRRARCRVLHRLRAGE